MDKNRWDRIRFPAPVSEEYPCQVGDVISHYEGFNPQLVLAVDEKGLPMTRLTMKIWEIPVQEEIKEKDDGTLYHTDRVSTEEEWRRLAGYAHFKTNESMRRRIWPELY